MLFRNWDILRGGTLRSISRSRHEDGGERRRGTNYGKETINCLMTHVPTQIQTREIAAQFRYRPLQATGIHANTKLVNI